LGGNPPLPPTATAPAPVSPASADYARVRRVPLNRVRPSPMQPRKEFSTEALKELADSIREQGIVQPLIVPSVTVSLNSSPVNAAGARRNC